MKKYFVLFFGSILGLFLCILFPTNYLSAERLYCPISGYTDNYYDVPSGGPCWGTSCSVSGCYISPKGCCCYTSCNNHNSPSCKDPAWWSGQVYCFTAPACSPSWTNWSACSVSCGGGTQTKSDGCGNTQTQACNTQSCGCEYISAVTEWDTCQGGLNYPLSVVRTVSSTVLASDIEACDALQTSVDVIRNCPCEEESFTSLIWATTTGSEGYKIFKNDWVTPILQVSSSTYFYNVIDTVAGDVFKIKSFITLPATYTDLTPVMTANTNPGDTDVTPLMTANTNSGDNNVTPVMTANTNPGDTDVTPLMTANTNPGDTDVTPLMTASTQQSDIKVSPTMTSNTAPSPYIVSATNEKSSYPAYKAFDGLGGTYWENTSGKVEKLKIDYGSGNATTVVRYILFRSPGYEPTTFSPTLVRT